MKKTNNLKNAFITFGILFTCFVLCIIIQYIFQDRSLIPAIFVMGAFLTSIITEGYLFGIVSALLSVLAVNFAFAFPFFDFDFTMPENIISGAILLGVTVITCSLTTKIKNNEAIKAESEKERMKANLLRAVSHDLRTPLTTIYGSSSAILEHYKELSDEQIKRMLVGIKEDSQWLNRMVENLLSITKLDNENVALIKTETVLDELIDSVLVKFKKRYPNQQVLVDIPEEFIVIPMDAILIEQVLINILENSVQHAEGMTKLSLKVFSSPQKAVFEVTDNGCGIPPEKIKSIFSGSYSAEETSYDGRKNNAGIGLSVCSSIIKAHGGEISAHNLKRGGCEFRFILNREESDSE